MFLSKMKVMTEDHGMIWAYINKEVAVIMINRYVVLMCRHM